MKRVLIVDDDVTVLESLAQMLRLAGYEVFTAPDALAGLRTADTYHPDAVLVDLRMPLVDGVGFLRRLRESEHHVHTPVAVVTGDYFIDETIIGEMRDMKALVYFKPLWLEDLVTITRELLKPTA